MIENITSEKLCSSVLESLENYDYYITHYLFANGVRESAIYAYVELIYDHLNCVNSFLRVNDFISNKEYDYVDFEIESFFKSYSYLRASSDLESASSDPDFMANVEKAVEKYGTIN